MTDDTRTLTLTDFLLARIAEVEAAARAFIACEWAGVDAWGEGSELFFGDYAPASPVGVLADCEAKRRIVAEHGNGWDDFGLPEDDDAEHAYCVRCAHAQWSDQPAPWPCPTLRFLALPHADHPDYRPEWRP